MKNIEFAIQILKQNHPFDEGTLHKYMDGDNPYEKNLRFYITDALGEYGSEKSSGVLEENLIKGILDGMNDYIRAYRSIPAFKQKIWDAFREWILCVSERLGFPIDDKFIEGIMEKPVEDDTAVAVVKFLHAIKAAKGMTKDEMASSLAVNEKTIRNALHLLDPKLDNDGKGRGPSKRNTPRFGGQLMQVGIAYAEEENKERKFYSPETMSPIALQLSVYQVGTLLKSLQLAYDTEVSYNSMNMAINVWSQLTDYCKDRVMTAVHPEDDDFHSFLDMIDDMESGQPFMTEKEIFEDELVGNKLNLAFKGSRRCNIKLKDKILRNCTIKYDCTKYYIHHEGKVYEALENEIEDIILLDD